MVDAGIREPGPEGDVEPDTDRTHAIAGIDWSPAPDRAHGQGRRTAVLVAVILAAGSALALGLPGLAQPVRATTSPVSPVGMVRNTDPDGTHHGVTPPTADATTIVTAPTTTTNPTGTTPPEPKPAVTSSAPALKASVTTTVTEPPVAALVAEVEAAGVEPGSTWSWSMGDTATQCGAIPGNSAGTGCTFGPAGLERSVFAGSPSLALVAHELANAETGNDAVPSLMSEVTAAEAGTSWSPMDAVASCLVEHFMGFEDDAAGSWQCPAALATVVAENIHDTVSTTEIMPSCGTTSGVTSTLTFTGSAGTLTVTAPTVGAAPETVAAGTPVTVSGIGTFTAVDRGGAITQTGGCTP
jgi:hypothetical protein